MLQKIIYNYCRKYDDVKTQQKSDRQWTSKSVEAIVSYNLCIFLPRVNFIKNCIPSGRSIVLLNTLKVVKYSALK